MATYATDLSVFDAADADTNWSELSGHSSGAAPGADAENYFQNSSSVSQPTGQASTTTAGMECDYGSAITWTDGWVIIAWLYYSAPTNLNTWTNGGYRMGVGSSSGNMYYWKASGSDFGDLPKAAWQNVAVDPNDPSGTTNSHLAADYTDGSPTSSKQIYGTLPNVLAKITKGNPHANDVIRYGRGEIYATGTSGTFAGYATANDADTAKWGLFEAIRGGYLWKGLFSFGQSATSLTFSDSNVTIFLDDTPRVQSDFNKMQTLNSSTSVTWNGVNIIALATSVTGSAPVAPGVFDFSTGTIDINGGRFANLGAWTFSSTDTIDDATFDKCGQVTQGSSTITNVIFNESSAAVSLVVSSLADVTGCTFNSDGSNHAINLGTISTTATISWDNTANDYASSNGSTGNETILVSVDSGITLTINVEDGATTPTYYNTGTGTVSVITGSVTASITVQDESKTVIENAQVSLHKVSDGTVIMNEDTLATGIASEVYTGTTPVDAVLRVRKSEGTDSTRYIPFSDVVTIAASTGITRTVTLKENTFLVTDTTAPQWVSFEVGEVDSTTLVMVANEAFDTTSVPATTAFTVSGNTVSSVSLSSLYQVRLTLGTAVTSSDTVTVSYTVPGSNELQDLNGNDIGALSSQSVSNNVNMLTNGTFDSDTWWSKWGTTTIADGVAHCNQTATSDAFLGTPTTVGLEEGETYRITFDVSGYTSGIFTVELGLFGDSNTSTTYSAADSYSVDIVCPTTGGSNLMRFEAYGEAIDLDIDNVTMVKI